MYIASLMALACPQYSLPIMLKLLSIILCLVWCMCAWKGEGCFRCSLHLSPRFLDVSLIYSSLQTMLLHWKLYITPLLLSLGSWSLGFMRSCFMVVWPLKCTWIPYLQQTCLKLSAIPLVYGITIWPIVDSLAGEGIGCLESCVLCLVVLYYIVVVCLCYCRDSFTVSFTLRGTWCTLFFYVFCELSIYPSAQSLGLMPLHHTINGLQQSQVSLGMLRLA